MRKFLVTLYGEKVVVMRDDDGKFIIPNEVKNLGGTALKPAHEPIVLARKPLSEPTVAASVLKWGTGALNVDACRLLSGRWPANILLSHSPDCVFVGTTKVKAPVINRFTDGAKPFGGGAGHPYETVQTSEDGLEEIEVWACVPGCPVRMLDGQSGPSTSRKGKPRKSKESGEGWGMTHTGAEYEDTGGPSRFFYTTKVGRKEREAGLDGLPSNHPTMKPIALMRYIVRLVTPPGGLVLDPFAGSGTTGIACALESCRFVGFEQEPGYVEIARARIRHWIGTQTDLPVGE